jgi:hypothetical protein
VHFPILPQPAKNTGSMNSSLQEEFFKNGKPAGNGFVNRRFRLFFDDGRITGFSNLMIYSAALTCINTSSGTLSISTTIAALKGLTS